MAHNETITSKLKDSPVGQVAANPAEHERSLLRGRVLIGVGLTLLVVFVAITLLVFLLDPLSLDVPITKELQEIDYGPFGWLMVAVSAPGFEPWNFIFPLVIVGALVLLRRIVEAGFMLLATIGSGSAVVVKELVHRARPSADLVNVVHNLPSYSFPSGHVTEYTIIFGFCFYLAFTLLKPTALRTILLVLLGAMILLVGPSRVWLGQHWASDVLGGYALGFGLLALIIWAYRGVQARIVKDKT